LGKDKPPGGVVEGFVRQHTFPCRPFTGTCCEEQVMNKNQVKGRVTEAKGFVKEVAGKLVGNEKLEQKGKVQKVLGEAQAEIGDIKQDVKNAKKRS
jgi:uncharacterized protein YjbJ (UPF0337 family)